MPTKKESGPAKKSTKKPTKKSVGQLINHIAKVVDRSGSIEDYHLTDGVMKTFNSGVKSLAEGAAASAQATYLSIYTFGPVVDLPLLFEANPASSPKLSRSNYRPSGGTAMLDAVGQVITDFDKIDTSSGDHAFVVDVISDGEENSSTKFGNIERMMREKMALGNWTLVFSVPRGYKTKLARNFNIPLGNIQEWDQTEQGLKDAARQTDVGMKSYFTGRSTGMRATRSFFETDLSNVTKTDLRKNLEDVTDLFRHFKVEKEVEIRPFVEAKTGGEYRKGTSYYELMKVEKVQEIKKLLIQERKGGKLWGGPAVRGVLNMPVSGEIRVHPGIHGEYRVFVESTSTNRKLVRGTTVLVVRD